jgi:prevent-host-death family protein
MKTVGAYEAKTHLPRLLEEVASGERVMITKHGEPVAMLVPVSAGKKLGIREAIAGLRSLRASTQVGQESLQDLVEKGRRF